MLFNTKHAVFRNTPAFGEVPPCQLGFPMYRACLYMGGALAHVRPFRKFLQGIVVLEELPLERMNADVRNLFKKRSSVVLDNY